MNDTLNIYHIKGLDVDMDSNCMTIKGVQLEDILHEYSVEDIVEALIDTDKSAEVFDMIARLAEEE